MYCRMTPIVALRLIAFVRDRIIMEKSFAIPVHIQVLITLRFLAPRSFQRSLSQDFEHPVGQSTASRCIARVPNAINGLADMFVQFPALEQMEHIQNR